MNENNVRPKGRPVMKTGKRIKKVDVRFTEEEFKRLEALEKTLGINKTELVRMRLLKDSATLVINAKDFIQRLDALGASLSRIGNNINQLVRYANVLDKSGVLSAQIIERFNQVMADYINAQQQLELVLRKIIRSMGK